MTTGLSASDAPKRLSSCFFATLTVRKAIAVVLSNTRVSHYANLICTATPADITADCTLNGQLVMDCLGPLTVSYAPFDHVNQLARVVLVGITPGRQQATNGLLELRRHLLAGADVDVAMERAKAVASFSGPMRRNLIDQLDYFRINDLLTIKSCASLFGEHAELVHYTSALRYPVFINGPNYAGTPSMTDHPLLRRYLIDYFAEEARMLKAALFLPLGEKVAKALRYLAREGVLDPDRILDGFQHPSGANAERIAYMLDRKSREALSAKTRADIIEKARTSLFAKIERLRQSERSCRRVDE